MFRRLLTVLALSAAMATPASSVLAQAPLPEDSGAPVDTSILLDIGATVVVPRLRLRPVGSTGVTARTDQLPGVRSVAEVLDAAGVHVRQYGPGTLASVSVRGGSSAQTLALWNGLPVTNPSLGLIDWNLLSLAPSQRVTLTRGGNASAWGSGAVAGTVHLEDLPPRRSGLTADVGLSAGAFGERGSDVSVGFGRGRWSSSLRADAVTADNDYPSAPAPGLPPARLTNAAQRRVNVRTAIHFRPRPTDRLSLHYWLSNTTREIPPTVVQTRSAAVQEDDASRVSLRYRCVRERITVNATGGYFSETLDYRDSLSGVDAESAFQIGLADASVIVPLRQRQTVSFGAAARHTRATVDDAYEGTPTELAVSGMAGYRLMGEKFRLQADLRYGRASGKSLGFTPALGIEYLAAEALTVRARFTRDYRAPTFNDRYYQPGGNPELLPERGYGAETGLDFRQNRWHATLTAYYRRTDDWILWARPADARFFSAYNLTAVTSAGLEPRLSYQLRTERGDEYDVRLGYDLTRSTNDVAVALPNIPAGEQLWYVPVHSGFATASAKFTTFRLRYTHRWRGPSLGINEDVDASDTGDLHASARLPWAGREVHTWIEIRNVFDVDYRLIERRPLPGRHLRGGVRVKL